MNDPSTMNGLHVVGFGTIGAGLLYIILALRKAGIKFDLGFRVWTNGKKKDEEREMR